MTRFDVIQICKALSDANRMQIIHLLLSGEMCACRLLEEFNCTQPTLSHHMKILCESNLVAVRKSGKWCHYSLNIDSLRLFNSYFAELINKSDC